MYADQIKERGTLQTSALQTSGFRSTAGAATTSDAQDRILEIDDIGGSVAYTNERLDAAITRMRDALDSLLGGTPTKERGNSVTTPAIGGRVHHLRLSTQNTSSLVDALGEQIERLLLL